MAWTYEQNFDSLNDGTINGQDSWTSSDSDVGSAYAFAGAKGVELTAGYMERTITAVTSGSMYFAFKYETPSTGSFSMKIDDGTNYGVMWNLDDDGSADYRAQMYTSAGYRVIVDGLDKTKFYIWNIEFDNSTDEYRVRYKESGGSWSSWVGWYDYNSARGNSTRFRYQSDTGGIAYIDEISASEPVPGPSPSFAFSQAVIIS